MYYGNIGNLNSSYFNNLGFSFSGAQRAEYGSMDVSSFTAPTVEMINRAASAYLSSQRSQNEENWHGNVANSTPDFVGNNQELAESIVTGAGLGYTFSGGNPWALLQGAAGGLVQGIVSQVTADNFDDSDYSYSGGGNENNASFSSGGGYDFGGWGKSTSASWL